MAEEELESPSLAAEVDGAQEAGPTAAAGIANAQAGPLPAPVVSQLQVEEDSFFDAPEELATTPLASSDGVSDEDWKDPQSRGSEDEAESGNALEDAYPVCSFPK